MSTENTHECILWFAKIDGNYVALRVPTGQNRIVVRPHSRQQFRGYLSTEDEQVPSHTSDSCTGVSYKPGEGSNPGLSLYHILPASHTPQCIQFIFKI